ncbi:MAG TPA: ribosome maturation factor RimM [Steroidobacteraceae bacterium]|nr:ribosome maturation factor RimM [Steroidobacteraceae bacterium]
MSDALVEVGRLGAAHGVRGWLRVQSFTDPPARLFEWDRWLLQSERGAEREVQVLEARQQGDGWIALLDGVVERDAASRLTGQLVLVERERLPPTRENEHYRDDLVGFEAKNLEGAVLGAVDHFVDTPGNVVMVIKGEREHWVPVTQQHLRSVDVQARAVIVDWPEDF